MSRAFRAGIGLAVFAALAAPASAQDKAKLVAFLQTQNGANADVVR